MWLVCFCVPLGAAHTIVRCHCLIREICFTEHPQSNTHRKRNTVRVQFSSAFNKTVTLPACVCVCCVTTSLRSKCVYNHFICFRCDDIICSITLFCRAYMCDTSTHRATYIVTDSTSPVIGDNSKCGAMLWVCVLCFVAHVRNANPILYDKNY